MVHGHLTPYNILFGKNKNVVLGDYYFLALRKKMIYGNEYIMWSPYSAPEVLGNDRVPKFEKYSDIYSLGVILWQIFEGIEPFGGLQMGKLNEVVTKKKLRPKINETYPHEIGDLINICWSDDVLTRPTSEGLAETVSGLVSDYD
jgi:serine/threonine protein kinase